NKTNPSRRRFSQALGSGSALAMLGAGGAFGLAGCSATGGQLSSSAPSLGRVLVVGGGYGGATAAKYLRMWGGPGLDVTLVEREQAFVSCPLSNLVLGGSRTIEDLTTSYSGLQKAGITVLHDEVTAIDPATRQVSFGRGASQRYDRIVLSPGV